MVDPMPMRGKLSALEAADHRPTRLSPQEDKDLSANPGQAITAEDQKGEGLHRGGNHAVEQNDAGDGMGRLGRRAAGGGDKAKRAHHQPGNHRPHGKGQLFKGGEQPGKHALIGHAHQPALIIDRIGHHRKRQQDEAAID
ncbi:hypothetical protein E4T56_gene17300, partial [Termitomyces sp. T112]